MIEHLSFILDTNVIIQFEEVGPDRKIKNLFQELHALLLKNKIQPLYHPSIKEDLASDKDEGRLTEMSSRIGKYICLENPPLGQKHELEKIFGGINSKNDLIDCQLLFAIYRNCATYLVTEDQGIHKRAGLANLDDRVIDVSNTIELLKQNDKSKVVNLPNVNKDKVYNLNIEDPIFDSLRDDYDDFEGWIAKISREHRECWYIEKNDRIAGICIYKQDEKQEHKGIDMPSMKLSTFKVSDEHPGEKLGELLYKTAYSHAVANNYKSMWLTTYKKQESLISFLKQFGFVAHANLKGEEMIFYKVMEPPSNLPLMKPLEYHIRYSPYYYDDDKIDKFVIPIKPKFHDTLFPEAASQLSLPGMGGKEGVPGNTIRKIYLCHARIKEIPVGSLIYFYRSSPQQYIHTLGIVERARRLKDMESLATAIGRRSVYSLKQVKEMAEEKKVLVIDFRLIAHCKNPIDLKVLIESGVLNSHPQSIMKLDEKQYVKLKKLWNN